jgi:hypothetical protein
MHPFLEDCTRQQESNVPISILFQVFINALYGSKGIQAVRIDFFLFISKVANIRCFILIKCSEQEARFKKICYNVVISEKNSNVYRWNRH